MSVLQKAKDGGRYSPVDAYFLIEVKCLFSIALLKFNKGTRENLHSHAFDALTWFICGDLVELDISGDMYIYKKSIFPKLTRKAKTHKVIALKDSWCFTIRGKWQDTWTEYNELSNKTTTLTHGRKVLSIK